MAGEDLQFDRVEPSQDQPTAARCSGCQRPIEDAYFSVGERTFCPSCKEKLERELRDSRGSLGRGILLGAGAAVLGTALYFGVAAITGYEIGLIAIAVGWLVGRGVQKGSGGTGGRRYQIAAVVLTYLSIAASYTAMAVKQIVDQASRPPATADSLAAGPSLRDSASGGASDSAASGSAGGVESAILGLLLLTLGLPLVAVFGDLPGGLLSALIIGIGLHQAWRMNQRVALDFLGPFQMRRPAPPPVAESP